MSNNSWWSKRPGKEQPYPERERFGKSRKYKKKRLSTKVTEMPEQDQARFEAAWALNSSTRNVRYKDCEKLGHHTWVAEARDTPRGYRWYRSGWYLVVCTCCGTQSLYTSPRRK